MFSDLFWAIYWIDVLSRMPSNLVGGALAIALVAVAVVIFGSLIIFDRHGTTAEQDRADALVFRKKVMWFAVVAFVVNIMFTFIPSKSTMYMMLGVKTTEHVVDSPLGQKLQAIVDAEVDGYLKKLSPKKD